MWRNRFVCLTVVLLLLVVVVSCQVGYSAEILTLDDLPGSGETLVIDSDSILTVDVGETALSLGVLTIQGTGGSKPEKLGRDFCCDRIGKTVTEANVPLIVLCHQFFDGF